MVRRFGALAVLVSLAVPACGDDGSPQGTSQDFTGAYSIVSFAQGTASSVTPVPGAGGTVTLTATTYSLSVTVPPLIITDSGTYTAIGTATAGAWTQQSTVDATFQSTGTYEVDPATNRLTLDTTVQGTRNVIVLEKT